MLLSRLTVGMLSIGVTLLGAGAVSGQNYPIKPIRIITTPAGGSADVAGRASDFALAMHVVHDDSHAVFRHLDPVAMQQRARRVLVAAQPVLAHRGAGEFVVLGITLIGLLLVDQMQDGDLGQVADCRLRSSSDRCSSGTFANALWSWTFRLCVLR